MVFGDRFAFGDRLYEVDRTAELTRARFNLRQLVFFIAETRMGFLDRTAELLQLVLIEREAAIDTALVAAVGEMLFQHRRPRDHASNTAQNPH